MSAFGYAMEIYQRFLKRTCTIMGEDHKTLVAKRLSLIVINCLIEEAEIDVEDDPFNKCCTMNRLVYLQKVKLEIENIC